MVISLLSEDQTYTGRQLKAEQLCRIQDWVLPVTRWSPRTTRAGYLAYPGCTPRPPPVAPTLAAAFFAASACLRLTFSSWTRRLSALAAARSSCLACVQHGSVCTRCATWCSDCPGLGLLMHTLTGGSCVVVDAYFP
jgi:hypothetical protein